MGVAVEAGNDSLPRMGIVVIGHDLLNLFPVFHSVGFVFTLVECKSLVGKDHYRMVGPGQILFEPHDLRGCYKLLISFCIRTFLVIAIQYDEMKSVFVERVIRTLHLQVSHGLFAGVASVHFVVSDDMVFISGKGVPDGIQRS